MKTEKFWVGGIYPLAVKDD